MKTFIQVVTYFVLLYPLFMAVVWMIGGITYHLRKRTIKDAEEQESFTIIVPVYNEAKNIHEHLLHNLNLDYANFKIWAVDDRSTDDSYAIMQTITDPRLILYQNEENMGKAATLNKLVDELTDEYFIVIDSDTMLDVNSLTIINNKIQDNKERDIKDVAGYTGNITVHTDDVNKVFRMQKIEYRSFIDMIKRSQMLITKSVMTLSGACSIYRTESVREVGKFSTKNATEDINMSWRLNMNGYRLEYIENLYSSVTTPEYLFDLIMQRKRWTNGLLQTIFQHVSDLFTPKNWKLKFFAVEIFISSLWAFAFLFTNIYYIVMILTHHLENLYLAVFLLPTGVMFIFSTLLAFSAYELSDNKNEKRGEFLRYYLLFPFIYFYVQPIGYVLGFIETIKKKSNEKWRRALNVRRQLALVTFIDMMATFIIVELILELFEDFNYSFSTTESLIIHQVIIGIYLIIYFGVLNFGASAVGIKVNRLSNPAFYILIVYFINRILETFLIITNVLDSADVYRYGILEGLILILIAGIIFEIVCRFRKNEN